MFAREREAGEQTGEKPLLTLPDSAEYGLNVQSCVLGRVINNCCFISLEINYRARGVTMNLLVKRAHAVIINDLCFQLITGLSTTSASVWAKQMFAIFAGSYL